MPDNIEVPAEVVFPDEDVVDPHSVFLDSEGRTPGEYTAADYGVNVSKADIEYDNRKAKLEEMMDESKGTKEPGIESPWLIEERRRWAMERATTLNFDNVSDLLDATERIVNYIETGQIALTPVE